MGVSVGYRFYLNEYGGSADSEAFYGALPSALRIVRGITGGAEPEGDTEEGCWRRAVCAAVDSISEYGEGRIGGFSLGGFSVTQHQGEADSGAELARRAALWELAGTSLAFSGVR